MLYFAGDSGPLYMYINLKSPCIVSTPQLSLQGVMIRSLSYAIFSGSLITLPFSLRLLSKDESFLTPADQSITKH